MSEKIQIHVDGKALEADKGQMLIEVTDEAGIYIPRFCYHKKLSVAANCRMCLVDMEKGRKPMPACATPVADGMAFHTKNQAAVDAQRATMEFLLINHPLDCPICDQGGECELQDQAMAYGRDVSRFNDNKRVVKDKNLGPFISTDMTRCIHCTRCVRFSEEICGSPEMGALGRGEDMQIGTYLEKTVEHELSGNMIDVCPVGALNSKPFRFQARSWEMLQVPTIAMHDGWGSHIYAHVHQGQWKRTVPRENEHINETWISDRDRFAYQGLHTQDRLGAPMRKKGSRWVEVSWSEALEALAGRLQNTPSEQAGWLVAPSTTLEEGFLLQTLAAHFGAANIDHRLYQTDFSSQQHDATAPALGLPITKIAEQQAIWMVGSAPRQEIPLLALKLRQADAAGAKVMLTHAGDHHDAYVPHAETIYEPKQANALLQTVLSVAKAVSEQKGVEWPNAWANALEAKPDESHTRMAAALIDSQHVWVCLGLRATTDARFGAIQTVLAWLVQAVGGEAKLGQLGWGANSTGLALAGVLPHRDAHGAPRDVVGLDAQAMREASMKLMCTYGLVDEADGFGEQAEFLTAFTPYASEYLLEHADLLLPIAANSENNGTLVNLEGNWQQLKAVIKPLEKAKAGWKALRQLAGLVECKSAQFNDLNEIYNYLGKNKQDIARFSLDKTQALPVATSNTDAEQASVSYSLYSVDPILRRAQAIQAMVALQAAVDDEEVAA